MKFFNRVLLALFSVVLTAAPLCGCFYNADDSPLKYYVRCDKEVFASGITFTAAVRGGDEQAALNDMLALMDEIDCEMSLTKADSALSKFNGVCDTTTRVKISQNLYELVRLSVEYYDVTGGKLNIAVYPLVKLWGLTGDTIDGAHEALPTSAEIAELLPHCNPHGIVLEEKDDGYYMSKLDPHLKIDLGAVAKGYAADKCVEIANAHGAESALVNIGGNVSLLGEWYHPTKKRYVRWEVGVIAPRPRGGITDLCALSVSAGTLVTSGDYMRYYVVERGETQLYVPHIVDGESGLPLGITVTPAGYENASDFVISATVISLSSCDADAYATALCLMGYDGAVEFMLERGLHGIILTTDKRAAFVGVSTGEADANEYLVYKDEYSGYKNYEVEEFTV